MIQEFGSLAGQQIVVTGGSSGIGAAVVRACAAAGADIILNCRTSVVAAESVAKEVRSTGRRCEVIAADVSVESDRNRLMNACLSSGPPDAVVLNAGADLLTGSLREASFVARLQALLDVDVTGTIMLARQFAAEMKQQGRGCLLTVGWDQAERGMEGDSGELFAAAKNAVMGFTRSLSVSAAPEVRVNCIAPGWIRTAWGETASDYWQNRVMTETPLKRWGTPEDIAATARFLLSSDASFITGQIINVNGGAVR